MEKYQLGLTAIMLSHYEQCDDGNTNNNDGCSDQCKIEQGWNCGNRVLGQLSVCGEACGNGIRTSKEMCDDGNTKNGDGCDSNCKIEIGYTCNPNNLNEKSVCNYKCGDGVIAARDVILLSSLSENCDDGNVIDGDGCSSTCNVEVGWSCGVRIPSWF